MTKVEGSCFAKALQHRHAHTKAGQNSQHRRHCAVQPVDCQISQINLGSVSPHNQLVAQNTVAVLVTQKTGGKIRRKRLN